MKLANEAGWQAAREANTDPYGKAVLDFAERWADAMEARMTAGETLEAVAKPIVPRGRHRGDHGVHVWRRRLHSLPVLDTWGAASMMAQPRDPDQY